MSLLEARDVSSGYGEITVLRDLSLEVDDGDILSVIGPNGAGKTTLMRTLMGLIEPTAGSVHFRGEEITRVAAEDRVREGITLVPEERNLYRDMTVRENLVLGAYRARGAGRDERLEQVFELFPRLSDRRSQRAGTLSGGEAQMLAIGRALMTDPDLVLFDEPSLGLAPKLIPELFDRIDEINREGVTVVLVEQRAREALELADRGCLLENGEITYRDDAGSMLEDERTIERYLGGS